MRLPLTEANTGLGIFQKGLDSSRLLSFGNQLFLSLWCKVSVRLLKQPQHTKTSFQKVLLCYSKERPNFPSTFVKTNCKRTPKNCTEWTRSTITSVLPHQPELRCPKFMQVPFWKFYLSVFEPSSAWCIPHPLIPPKENHFSRYPDTHSCFHSWFVTVSTASC